MTDLPGSSEYTKLNIVTYANEAKEQMLGVKASTLELHGAVSAETAEEMVEIGVQMYESLPGYKDGVRIYGSIAFGVRYDGDGKANLLPNLSDN